MSELEQTLAAQILAERLPKPEREVQFHTGRKWRFDFAWPAYMLAAEVEGGTWANSRHTRGGGFRKDCEKYNQAALDGWTVLRFTAGMINEGKAALTISEAIKQRSGQI